MEHKNQALFDWQDRHCNKCKKTKEHCITPSGIIINEGDKCWEVVDGKTIVCPYYN